MIVLALADDLTGALEVGAKFAGTGIGAVAGTELGEDAPVVVIDAETRHLAPDEAAARISSWAAAGGEARWLFLKTDSTLRGPIAAEFAALLRAWPDSPLVYVPAYPEMGRTVKQGRLYVDGVPVHQTAFARDEQNPVTESHIPALLGHIAGLRVCDGETSEDVAAAARDILRSGVRLVAGPAALAQALAERLDVPREAPRPWPRVRTCLVINGSRHQRSVEQVRHAVANGIVGDRWKLLEWSERARVRKMADDADAVAVFGGDTAYEVVQALGGGPLYPLGELAAGVPLSRMRDRYLITKAGGFGPVDILSTLQGILD